jgi:LPXTG-motif cell wall-anchored protein
MKKRVLAILISIAMLVICLVPTTALAADPVTIDLSAPPIADDTGYTVSGNAITLTGGDYVITGSTTTCYLIAAANANVTLNNASIDATSASQCAFYINDGVTVNMTLTGASTLTSGGGYAGIDATPGRTLIITAASTGSLTVTGGDGDGERGGAGIGGGSWSIGGMITISGGTVTANGGINGAGIGGGYDSGGGTIAITGGTVTAYGGRAGHGTSNGGAGIGGGARGDGGTITISGGTVTAIGHGTSEVTYGSAGIGGGSDGGNGGTITISGGSVFATGIYTYDIGAGNNAGGGTLGISGTAAVFLRNDACITPTTTHTHETITAVTDGKVYGITVLWAPNFGAYLSLRTLDYNVNGGSGVAPSSVTQAVSTTVTVPDGSGLSKTNYAFSGWNTAADGSGTAYAAGSTFTFTAANTILYAQWTAQPELTSSVTNGTIYVGGRITLTPNLGGGTWNWDEDFFTATFNSPATFTALKAGTSTISYTVEGVSVTYDVTIEASALPSTGQDFTIVYVFAGLAALAFSASIMTVICKKRKKA